MHSFKNFHHFMYFHYVMRTISRENSENITIFLSVLKGIPILFYVCIYTHQFILSMLKIYPLMVFFLWSFL